MRRGYDSANAIRFLRTHQYRLADLIMTVAGKRLEKRHTPDPLGVRGRNSDNRLIREKLGWAPSQPLIAGWSQLTHGLNGRFAATGIPQIPDVLKRVAPSGRPRNG